MGALRVVRKSAELLHDMPSDLTAGDDAYGVILRLVDDIAVRGRRLFAS